MHPSPMSEERSTRWAKRSHIAARTDRHSTSTSSRSSSSSQTSHGPTPHQLPIQPDYDFSYDFVDHRSLREPSIDPEIAPDHDATAPKEDPSYEFRLFSTTTPTHITLPRSPSPSTLTSAGKFLRPRPDADYLTSSLPASILLTLRSQYSDAAVAGADIIHAASNAWPGTKIPWKVTRLPAFAKQVFIHRLPPTEHTVTAMSAEFVSLGHESLKRRRTKPNKKRRIFLRSRQASTLAARKREEVTKTELQHREAQKKGKMLERNRGKQRRKRERMKSKTEQQSSARAEKVGERQEIVIGEERETSDVAAPVPG